MSNVRVLATGLEFPEGPVAMPDGSVVLVEIRGRRLTRVWPDGRKEVVEGVFGMLPANGIGLSPDENTVYVAETPTARLWAFDLSAPGTVKPRDVIYRGERGKPIAGLGGYQMFDSLAVEACGNVCVATLISGCISVIAADGAIVEQVPTGDRVTTNIAFGGPELKTAYITLSGKGELIAMDWARPGLPLNFLNK